MKFDFEVSDVTRPLVAVGGLQKRGMAVATVPHGSFVTRGRVDNPRGNPRAAVWSPCTRTDLAG